MLRVPVCGVVTSKAKQDAALCVGAEIDARLDRMDGLRDRDDSTVLAAGTPAIEDTRFDARYIALEN
jgi:hypothetical protein